jgi:hypothetical protein
LPVNILIPPPRKLTRLRLALDATSDGPTDEPVVAYDLFPPDAWKPITHDLGTASVDVGKALVFLSPVIGDVLGLKLSFPLKWTTTYVSVRCSDRLSNPVEWYITDETIDHGFTGYVIWRKPKGSQLKVSASLLGELRDKSMFGRLAKAQFKTDTETYSIAD